MVNFFSSYCTFNIMNVDIDNEKKKSNLHLSLFKIQTQFYLNNDGISCSLRFLSFFGACHFNRLLKFYIVLWSIGSYFFSYFLGFIYGYWCHFIEKFLHFTFFSHFYVVSSTDVVYKIVVVYHKLSFQNLFWCCLDTL